MNYEKAGNGLKKPDHSQTMFVRARCVQMFEFLESNPAVSRQFPAVSMFNQVM